SRRRPQTDSRRACHASQPHRGRTPSEPGRREVRDRAVLLSRLRCAARLDALVLLLGRSRRLLQATLLRRREPRTVWHSRRLPAAIGIVRELLRPMRIPSVPADRAAPLRVHLYAGLRSSEQLHAAVLLQEGLPEPREMVSPRNVP